MNQDSKGLIRQLNIDFKNCKEVLGLKLKKIELITNMT